jgi:hypothetical protein
MLKKPKSLFNIFLVTEIKTQEPSFVESYMPFVLNFFGNIKKHG